MKKLILTTAIIATFAASSAFAKTEGSYLGIDVLRTKADVKTSKVSSTNLDTYFDTKTKDSTTGFGVNYKYAFNVNDFFIAPGLIYESIGAETKVNDVDNGYTQDIKIKDRLGAKVDFGFDITDKFAAYIPVGYARTSYTINTNDYISGGSSLQTKTTASQGSMFYGFGLVFYPVNSMSINLEYNRSSIDLKSGGNVAPTLKAKANLDVIKFGVAYHF